MSTESLGFINQPQAELPRNVKLFPISVPLLTNMFKTGNHTHTEVVEGLPEDARIIGIFPDPRGAVGLLVQSKEFPTLIVGAGPQTQDITIKSFDCNHGPEDGKESQ